MAQTQSPETRHIFISYTRANADFANRLVADLRVAGHPCWIDTSDIEGGADWFKTIIEAIKNCSVFVIVVTRAALQSQWVRDEILCARDNGKKIIPLLREDVFGEEYFYLLKSYQGIACSDSEYATALPKLLNVLPSPPAAGLPRELALAYLTKLKQNELAFIDRYTPLSGGSQRRIRLRIACSLEPAGRDTPTQPFVDAVTEIPRLRRAVLLGEPGGGKTTILWKLVDKLAEAARHDHAAPLPLLIPLGFWTRADQPLREFIAAELEEQLPGLGAALDGLLAAQRAALLLDGLNELPVGQRAAKYPQVKRFIEAHPAPLAVVSCRQEDYAELELGFDRIVIKPLDALQIREFAGRYLGAERGESLFWKLAGEEARQHLARFTQAFAGKLAEPERVFWVEAQLPDGLRWGWSEDKDSNWYWERWLSLRETPSSLMLLACNPYMLWMLTRVFDKRGELPVNRGALFREFVAELLARESEHEEISADDQTLLIGKLAEVAYAMQIQPAAAGMAATVLPVDEVRQRLDGRLLRLASSASLLSLGEQVRFTHQLLQEYFAAQFMDNERRAGRLKADALWPPGRWWQRNNWEVAASLLAGLYSNDCTEVFNWLAAANPEIAVQALERSGAVLAEATRAATLAALRDQWLPRLDNPDLEPAAQARAAIGRALGQFGLDNRPGVGLRADGWPDIAWVEIPGGEFQYGAAKVEYAAKPQRLTLPTFWISRYPVTYAQFQSFVTDPEGYDDPRWWAGLKADDDDRRIDEPRFKFDNHPRDTVNWYQALAFCRWLSWRWGGGYDLKKIDEWKARLPTEFEWEKAARGTDGRVYPYGNEFKAELGNTHQTGIGQTSAVGIFSNGASPDGVEEMSGNVWEWCLSDYAKPQLEARKEKLGNENNRVLRGGSWFYDFDYARAVIRDFNSPGSRNVSTGFRLAVVCPPS